MTRLLFSKTQAWMSCRDEEKGASAVEYALMIGVFALFIVVAVGALGRKTSAGFNRVEMTWPS